MTNGSLSDDEGMDVEDFLDGFDFQEEMLMSNKKPSKFDENFESSPFVTQGYLAALEKICITELLSSLSLDCDIPQLSRGPASIDSDLSAWITYRSVTTLKILKNYMSSCSVAILSLTQFQRFFQISDLLPRSFMQFYAVQRNEPKISSVTS